MIRTENWYGHEIRFVEINGEWYAILKDICDALNLKTWHVTERLHPDMLERVLVDTSDLTSVKTINSNEIGKDIGRKRGERKTIYGLLIF